MEPDRKGGRPVTKKIEGFEAEKYKLRTTFTMTKYQLNMSEM
jgi:hypothetical protein